MRLAVEYLLAPEETKDGAVGVFVFGEALSKLASETSKRQSVWVSSVVVRVSHSSIVFFVNTSEDGISSQ